MDCWSFRFFSLWKVSYIRFHQSFYGFNSIFIKEKGMWNYWTLFHSLHADFYYFVSVVCSKVFWPENIHGWNVCNCEFTICSITIFQTFPPKLIELDFADMEMLPDVLSDVLDCYGYLDMLIINSSIKVKAPAQSLTLEMDKMVMDVNYFGPITLAKSIISFIKCDIIVSITLL